MDSDEEATRDKPSGKPAWLFASLRSYEPAWLARDAMAGLMLMAIALPGQLATAHLAGLPGGNRLDRLCRRHPRFRCSRRQSLHLGRSRFDHRPDLRRSDRDNGGRRPGASPRVGGDAGPDGGGDPGRGRAAEGWLAGRSAFHSGHHRFPSPASPFTSSSGNCRRCSGSRPRKDTSWCGWPTCWEGSARPTPTRPSSAQRSWPRRSGRTGWARRSPGRSSPGGRRACDVALRSCRPARRDPGSVVGHPAVDRAPSRQPG